MKQIKHLTKLYVSIAFWAFGVTAHAHNNVVVVPLLSSENSQDIKNIVTVAKQGAEYSSIPDALESINDATPDNHFIIYIGPGLFEISSNIEIPDNTSIIGSGVGITKLSRNRNFSSSAPFITMGENSTISSFDLSIFGGPSETLTAIKSTTGESTVSNLKIHIEGGSIVTGISLENSTLRVKNTDILITDTRANSIDAIFSDAATGDSLQVLSSNIDVNTSNQDPEKCSAMTFSSGSLLVKNSQITANGCSVITVGEIASVGTTTSTLTGASIKTPNENSPFAKDIDFLITNSTLRVDTFGELVTCLNSQSNVSELNSGCL